MIRLLILTDFTDFFVNQLIEGIVNYSRQKEQWVICRMPLSHKRHLGIPGVVKWAKDWGADAIIGQFEEGEDVELFRKNGIVAVAQDFKKRFSTIPNITADYVGTGRMAARFFLDRGFQNFGFFGFDQVCWSDERRDGFRREVEKAGFGGAYYSYIMQDIDQLWYYEQASLTDWLHTLPKPIAIFASDDYQGSNLIEACHSAGIRIPAEVSVMGVDNDELMCDLGSTSLTSIHVDIVEGGWKAAELIERLVADPSAPVEDIVMKPVRIVERMSTAAFGTEDNAIRKAIQFIHRNCRKKISVTDVMEEAALSRRLLERRFKDVTGKTLYQYISELKLKQFAEMLRETDDQVVNIALSLGESDTKSISRRFKQLYGCTPLEWRNKR